MSQEKKAFIVKGVGKLRIRKYDAPTATRRVYNLATMTEMGVTMTTEINDIFGGDGLYNIDDIAVSKGIDIRAMNTKFDLSMLRLMLGESGPAYASDYYRSVVDEYQLIGGSSNEVAELVITADATGSGNLTINLGGTDYFVGVTLGDDQIDVATKIATDATLAVDFEMLRVGDTVRFTAKTKGDVSDITFGAAATGVTATESTLSQGAGTVAEVTPFFSTNLHATPEFEVSDIDSGNSFTEVLGAPAPGQFQQVGSNITFNAADDGKSIAISYKINDANLDIYTVQAEELPFYLSVLHTGAYSQKDNVRQGCEFEFYQCRARGAITLNFNRAQASPVEVNLRVLNPERPDGRLGIFKRFAITQ